MALNEIFKPKSKEEIINMLEAASLSPSLVGLIKDDDESYELFLKILTEMSGSLEERVIQINKMSEIIKSTENN
jgi:hypothetical protein